MSDKNRAKVLTMCGLGVGVGITPLFASTFDSCINNRDAIKQIRLQDCVVLHPIPESSDRQNCYNEAEAEYEAGLAQCCSDYGDPVWWCC